MYQEITCLLPIKWACLRVDVQILFRAAIERSMLTVFVDKISRVFLYISSLRNQRLHQFIHVDVPIVIYQFVHPTKSSSVNLSSMHG